MNEKKLLEILNKLEQKYDSEGQNLESYLEGLYEADYLNYWDYIHLDALLSLQVKRTSQPDEEIFIIYHQVTELFFRLIMVELEQICQDSEYSVTAAENRLRRINRYFRNLIQSFSIMSEGLDPVQFMRFRMALFPASGFQSVQYRTIELLCTSTDNLIDYGHRAHHHSSSLEEKMAALYWRSGATDTFTGKKTLTLSRFEEKYDAFLLEFARKHQSASLNSLIESGKWGNLLPDSLQEQLRALDMNANLAWRKAHLQSASRFLKKPDAAVEGTGGTNWQKYLPPKFQRIVFFPTLWKEEELENWGRQVDGEQAQG